MRHRQRGVAGVLIVLILVLVLVGFIAAYALSRFTSSADDRQLTLKRLAAAQEALELYAARTMRLPCPADPVGNTGDEVQASAATCTFNQGTIPWNSIGLLREQGVDAWGRKIAYRVYTGNKGSLTQPRGVSMVECDTDEPSPGGTTDLTGSLGGLCLPDPPNTINLTLRTTTPAQFLNGKGLRIMDGSADYDDAAYVLISHGQSGLGGFTSSGASVTIDDKTDPKGDELDNTKATGPFVIKEFSDAETSILSNSHFDDFLAYRRLPDLISRIKLGARNWPDPTTDNLSVRFDAAPVGAAAGSPSPPAAGTNLATSSLAFGAATVTALTGGTTPQNFTYVDSGATGIGAGGSNDFISAAEFESVRIDLAQSRRKFAVTLANFGYLDNGIPDRERVTFRFFLNGSAVGSILTKQGCGKKFDSASNPVSPPPLATYLIDVGTDFDRVEITPLPAPLTAYFLLSEIAACTAGTPTCTTSLATLGNTCP